MGGLISKSMSQQMDKQKEFMMENGRITMERQIEMQNQMRERMIATEIARARERFYWLGAFYGVFFLGAFAGLVIRIPNFLIMFQWITSFSGLKTFFFKYSWRQLTKQGSNLNIKGFRNSTTGDIAEIPAGC